MTTDTPAIVDALPYIDTAIDDNDVQREMAMKMVDDEMLGYPPEQDYLSYLPDHSSRPFLTELLKSELQILDEEQGKLRSKAARDISKIEVDVPPPANSNMDEEETKLWNKSLKQVKIKLEYKQRQKINLDLIKTYGAPAWEQYIAEMERMEMNMKQEIEQLGSQIQDLNSQRKSYQQEISRHLDVLQAHWEGLSVGNRLLAEEIAEKRKELLHGLKHEIKL